ncbi:cilia- and flagella-associated protein 52 [Ischnura elegans]|uniref:cilia- and flagella-associated protein 52 n=1 Tax=Ischnura elegans TaxID=197161 RepID=UPI001ED88FDF|nr:cilia- and flagella-associated protein 52 [Ischnura elegans]
MDKTAEEENIKEVEDLALISVIGFEGGTRHGLISHPDKKHIIYPMGTKVIVQNWETKKQVFQGSHSNNVSAITISCSGKYIATGETTQMGFKAPVTIWDLEEKKTFQKYEIHKMKVVAVAFSSDERLVFSLGGRDDSNVIVWDLKNMEAICGSPAVGPSSGEVTTICTPSLHSRFFLTGGNGNLRIWNIIPETRTLKFREASVGMTKRHVLCIVVDEENKHMYCGTSTGDVMKLCLNLPTHPKNDDSFNSPALLNCMALVPFSKGDNSKTVDCYHNGVRALALLSDEMMIIGAGDGQVDMVREQKKKTVKPDGIAIKNPTKPLLKRVRCTSVKAEITSLVVINEQIIVGTMSSEIYSIDLKSFQVTLAVTCHTSRIYGIAFPYNYSKVFATSGENEIRVWNTEKSQELLRIRVPNFICTVVLFSRDGKSIVSAWNNGTIQAFTPQTGKIMYVIQSAHTKGVSAMDMTSDGKKIVSGGCEGQVRVWKVSLQEQILCGALQEHRGPVSSIQIKKNDKEAVSGCTDGTCIVWDLERLVRSQIIFANTLFLCVRYYPNGCQILTTGTDHKISYWETFDGSLIRELEGSLSAPVNSIDITKDGKYLVTASNDLLVKVWKYNEGTVTHVGVGHAGVVTAARVSDDGKYLVSVSSDGAIFIWNFPHELSEDMEEIATEDQEEADKTQDSDLPGNKNGESGKREENSKKTSKKVSSKTTKK